MQRLRKLQIAALVALTVIFGLAYARQDLLIRIEQRKVELLLPLVAEQPLVKIEGFLSTRGRVMSQDECSMLGFPPTPSGVQSTVYWIKGGLMVRLLHNGERVLAFDVRKLEFK
jgi:hypothetical protein